MHVVGAVVLLAVVAPPHTGAVVAPDDNPTTCSEIHCQSVGHLIDVIL